MRLDQRLLCLTGLSLATGTVTSSLLAVLIILLFPKSQHITNYFVAHLYLLVRELCLLCTFFICELWLLALHYLCFVMSSL
uniref:Uncharacterized protein n=1 Tax=Arundo donax TaxID=35708 RepID=A0A0A8YS40_ARUDO